jgi:SAM-dependent methyltransferase
MNGIDKARPLAGQTGGQHALGGLIDHTESYGRHVIDRFVRQIPNVKVAVDLGAGKGDDLAIVKKAHPDAEANAIEAGRRYALALEGKVDRVHVLDIERSVFPFDDESVDLFLANQILEHTKEVFWVFHQVSRCLKVGGSFIFGVPNIASLHNRLLLLLGTQPTQHKLVSAHVRPFSKADTMLFINSCFPGGYELTAFGGSQFYPFPARLSRVLADAFPRAAFSIFFMIQKKAEYREEFATYPTRARLETNFWTGAVMTGSQY